MAFVINVAVSATVISVASWVSRRYPATAGFIVAMPLASMLVLPLSQIQHGAAVDTVLFARSIFLAIPVSLMFFVPFLLAGRVGLGFWSLYAAGVVALLVGFGIHRLATRILFTGGG